MADILITGASIYTMEGPERVIEDGDIVIEGNRIVALGPRGSVGSAEQAKRVIDGSGMIALPGFINCHTHSAMTLLRGYADDLPLMTWLSEKIWPVEDKLEAEDIYWGAMLCCLEMIKSGTTTFADMYFCMEQVALAVEKSGLRACLSRGLIGNGDNAGAALKENTQLYEKWNGGADGRIKIWFGPHAPYTCPPEYLRQVLELANKYETGLHIHIAETLSEVEQIRADYGKTPVEHLDDIGVFDLPVLAAHCVHLQADDMEILARKQVRVAHCPESNMKLASGVAPVVDLIEAGVLVSLGTDGASSNNNLDMLEEMRSAAMLQKVSTMEPTAMDAFTALNAATANGARALGLADEIGLLQVGMKADLILIDKRSPHLCPQHNITANMVYAAHSADVDTMLVDGKIIMEHRRVLTLDEEEVMRQASLKAHRLCGS